MAKIFSDIAKVISVAPSMIEIEVFDPEAYNSLDDKILIGGYLKISDDNNLSIIAIVQSFKIKDSVSQGQSEQPKLPQFIIECQQVGCFNDKGEFKRGSQQIAIPPTSVSLASTDELGKIYQGISKEKQLSFGSLSQNRK